MNAYISDLVGIYAIEEPPENFWLWDFERFSSNSSFSIRDLEFDDQIDLFLSDPTYREMYGDHIVRDDNDTITASRCLIFMDNVDWDIVREQIDALEDQRGVTERQPINKGQRHWAFFTYFVSIRKKRGIIKPLCCPHVSFSEHSMGTICGSFIEFLLTSL